MPSPTEYTVKKGIVYAHGAKVGSVDAKGQYRVVDQEGKSHSGSIAALIKADVKSKLLGGGKDGRTGKVRVGLTTYEVRGGTAYFEGKAVGSVNATGDYALTVFDQHFEGNVGHTPGAVWLSSPSSGSSARIELAGKSFTALDGVIFDGGEEIGWLDEEGRFRGVTIDGDHFEGSLIEPENALYLRLTSTG